MDSWVIILADFGEASCSLLLAVLATYCGNAAWWKKADLHLKVVIHNLYAEYGHFTVNQTNDNVLNSVVKVTSGLWVSLAIPYIAIRIMEDIGSCDGGNVSSYCLLH
jgi:hypothetical protein